MVALERLEECRNPEIRREALRATDEVPESASTRRPGPDRVTEQRELRELLTEAMAELPEVQREIALLRDLERWKHREIAERLDLPSGTVRSHLYFARKALRKVLRTTLELESNG